MLCWYVTTWQALLNMFEVTVAIYKILPINGKIWKNSVPVYFRHEQVELACCSLQTLAIQLSAPKLKDLEHQSPSSHSLLGWWSVLTPVSSFSSHWCDSAGGSESVCGSWLGCCVLLAGSRAKSCSSAWSLELLRTFAEDVGSSADVDESTVWESEGSGGGRRRRHGS